MTVLCARYDVSRKTGYKWLERFEEGGRHGLQVGAGRRTIAPTRSPGVAQPPASIAFFAAHNLPICRSSNRRSSSW
jgi:Helix-turn-helix domain